MKRLFPRAVPQTVGLIGLLVFVNVGCSPNNSVKSGAPVLTGLSIVENGGMTTTTITADAITCATTVQGGGDCQLMDEPVDGGSTLKADLMCQTTTSDWCRCMGDPTMSPMGTWDCDPFSPMSVVVATFDRLLDSDLLAPPDGATSRSDLATISATPAPPVSVTTATDYSSTGNPNYFAFAGGIRNTDPSLQIAPTPAMPAGTTITLGLIKGKILAKDGKTEFAGMGPIVDGTLTFKTAPFGVQIGVPTAPPPDASADAAVDSGATADGGTEAGAEAGSEAGVDGGVLADASAPEVASEAGAPDGGASDAGAGDGAASDAAATEVASGDGALADATPAGPPAPGAPVPAGMNMAPVTLTFNNTIDTNEADADFIQKHLSFTENGAPFTAVTVDASMAPKLTITPKTMWAAGKTYLVTVDATTADVVGDTLKTAQQAIFVMAN